MLTATQQFDFGTPITVNDVGAKAIWQKLEGTGQVGFPGSLFAPLRRASNS